MGKHGKKLVNYPQELHQMMQIRQLSESIVY